MVDDAIDSPEVRDKSDDFHRSSAFGAGLRVGFASLPDHKPLSLPTG